MPRRKWSEVMVEEIDAMPFVDDTHTVKWWREKAKTSNILVKQKTDTTNARKNGEIMIEPCTASGDTPIGVLRSVTGDERAFPKKFMARIAIRAIDCNVDGDKDQLTGDIADDEFGLKIKPNADSKAVIVKAGQSSDYTSGGTGRVVGGTYENLRIAFDWIDHFR